MNQVRDAYSERSDEYTAALGSIEHTHPSDRELVSRWAQETSGSIVDAGCGPGHWTHFLHERGLDVQGIDLVPRFIKKARQRFPKASFHEGMLEALPFANNSLGGILAWYSLIHTPPSNLSRTLAELARVLKPGGSILVGFFDGPNIESFDHAVVEAYRWPINEMRIRLDASGLETTETHARTGVGYRPHAAIIAHKPNELPI